MSNAEERRWSYATWWPYLKPDAPKFLLALLLTPVVAGLGVAQPFILKNAIDKHITQGEVQGLWADAGWYLAAAIAAFAVEAVYTVVTAYASENSILRLRKSVVRHVLTLSQRFFERQPTGQLMSRATSDVDSLNEALAAGSISIVLDILTMLGVLAGMFVLDAKLTFLLLLVGPPIGAVVELCRRKMRTLFADIRDSLASLNAYVAERIAGIEVIQLFGLEPRVTQRFTTLNQKYRDSNVANNFYDAALYAFIDGVASVCIALILAYATGYGREAVTVGLVVAFLDYIERLFRPLRELSGKITFLQRAGTALDKLSWLLAIDDRITPGVPSERKFEGRLSIRNLRFRYRPDGPDILDGLSLEVEPGQVVAVVGRTGAGKSTLVRLLARVHDGYEGNILVDGAELREVPPADIRRAVGSVRQEVQLFRDTLRFNITLGDPSLDPARIASAIEESGAGKIAARNAEGLDRVLRERGTDLSAGEAQVISLARTLARDPAIVILDEATASVDPVSERILQDAMEHLFAKRTCLVIAHRISTITRADRIVVLDAGKVAESGTHAELLALNGAYASLYREGVAALSPEARPLFA